MKIRMKKILSLALAFTLAFSVPNPEMLVHAEEAGNVEVTAPALPSGFGNPLEDNNGLTLATGANTSTDATFGKVLKVATQWNNESKYHASIAEAEKYFKTTEFTVMLDVKPNAPSGDTNIINQRTALTIGTSANSLHLLTYGNTFGYGSNSGGICTNEIPLEGIAKGEWNAVAMTYKETEGGNGSVVIYVNGVKAGAVSDVGFKLSTMSGITSMIARTFDTNYLQEGEYDNIVVGTTALDEATALAETAYRRYNKMTTLPADTATLKSYITKAETFLANVNAEDFADLKNAYDAAVALVATEPNLTQQSAVDKATDLLVDEYEKANPEVINIKAADIDTAVAKPNGLSYKGFGMLNGNSTSNLLLDYKANHPDKYDDMMQYLFGGENPLFTHIKMEMGNDGNNSTGAEACTMRYEDEEADASRSPGFVMVADAKKINPNVKVSILRWEMPNWVKSKWNNNTNNQGYEAVYKWYSETIFDAYEKYGYVVDMVNPDKNETGDPDEAFIKWFANRIENETNFPDYFTDEAKEAYNSIRIIASDENKGLKIVPSMRSDSELYDAVDIIGFHYRTNATNDYVKMADVDDKEVWYSEGCATFGYSELQENKTSEYGYESIGGYQSPLALMDSFITAFESSRRTHYMFQPAIGSFYEGIQYGHKELLSARDPWSGYIHYDPALYMLEHFAKFAKTGWEDSDPTGNDIWRAISSATSGSFAGTDNEHATAGIDGDAGYMTLAAPDKKNFSVVFVNNTRNTKYFRINETDLDVADDQTLNFWLTETDNYMQKKGTIERDTDGWFVTLPPYSISTATTITVNEEELATPEEGIHNEDRAVLDTDADGKINGVTDDTMLYADDFDYEEENGYLASRGNEPRYMLDTHSAWIVEDGKLKQELNASINQWNGGEPSTIVGDFRWMDYVTSVDVTIPDGKGTARLTIRAQTGMNWDNSGYTFCISGDGTWELYRIGTLVGSGKVAVTEDNTYSLRLMGYGNMISAVVNGEAAVNYSDDVPMLSGRVKLSSTWNTMYFDNLKVETVAGGMPYATTMIDGQDDDVTYEGTWSITNPGSGSADNWYRTISSTSTANASFAFPIDGTGFAIIGGNNGTAVFDVYADDALVAENATTLASPNRGETYVYEGLADDKHNIKVVVKSGTLKIDAIHTLGTVVTAEEEVLIGVDSSLIAVKAGSDIVLPETVEVKTTSGTTVEKSVEWDESEITEYKEFEQYTFTGTVKDAVGLLGTPIKVSVRAEVVPEEVYYFIDMNATDPATGAVPESYTAIKKLFGEKLLNQVYDQYKTDDTTWGRVDIDAIGYDGAGDKTATGIYGKENKSGETIAYAFTLPAGSYKVTSAHHEWWPGWNDRPMDITISYNGKTIEAGTVGLKGSDKSVVDVINEAEFTLESEQLVTYTATATGSEAPVISWLAVSHAHTLGEYTDNANGTHSAECTSCGAVVTEEHEHDYKANEDGTHTGICEDCGNKTETSEHELVYKSSGKSGHKVTCSVCDYSATEEHTPVYTDNENGKHKITCEHCTYSKTEAHTFEEYKDNADGTHTGSCKYCDAKDSAAHTYENGVCTDCAATEPKPPVTDGGNAGNGDNTNGTDNTQHTHSYTYTDNGDGTHTTACSCGTSVKEAHTFINGICSACKAAEVIPSETVEPEITAVENVKKGFKVTWVKTDAVSYEVYRKAGSGKWTKVKTTTATSYTDKKANKNGTKYQYKVTYVNADGTKTDAPVVTTYRLTTPKLSSVKNVKGKKVTVKWAKNKKASGYEIAYATAKSFKGSKITNVSGGKKTSGTIKKLTKGKKYFVRVRSYKKSGKVKYYSAWSNVKNLKVKK